MKTWNLLGLSISLVVSTGVSVQSQDMEEPRSFHRGDANADGELNITDAIFTFGWLFLGGDTPSCADAVDSNDDAEVNITDGVFTLGFLFTGGEAPPYPGPEKCDLDPTEDSLGCEYFSPCACGGFVGKPCSKGEFCDMPPGNCGTADMLGYCVTVPDGCPKNLDPVCGCDGVTYNNDCERIRAGVFKAHDGPCASSCGALGERCDKGQFCELPAGSCQNPDTPGTCVDIPVVCPDVFDPVCGCDGVTYGNDCERRVAQVSKDHDGPCEKRCGLLGAQCDENQFCELPAGSCQDPGTLGTCVDIPVACPENFDPVCGCDGVTYGNDCERRKAQVFKDHDGPCEGPPPVEDEAAPAAQ